MKHYLLKQIIKVIYWLMFNKGTQLTSFYLLKAGWVIEDGYFVEPFVKKRDKVWVQLQGHYYRVYHGEERTFISLENSVEWLQLYLFTLDKHKDLKTRKLI